MLLWRVALGVSRFGRCRCRFGLSAYYDRGRVWYCQGGIFGNMSSGVGGGDSRLRGNDDGRGRRKWGNAKAQGRNEKQAGMT